MLVCRSSGSNRVDPGSTRDPNLFGLNQRFGSDGVRCGPQVGGQQFYNPDPNLELLQLECQPAWQTENCTYFLYM